MKRTAAAFLLLLAVRTQGIDPEPIDTSAALALDFATLTDAETRRLDGREALFRVTLDGDSEPEERDGFTCADCTGDAPPPRSLYLHAGQGVAASMTVKATLQIRYYPSLAGADGSAYPALWKYRLAGAVLVAF
jgi:hypothetical protein